MISVSINKIYSGILLVFGTTVGAGMLGIPSMMAGISFGSAFFVTAFVWIFMAITGLLLLEVTLTMSKGANLISLATRFLGCQGKWMVGFLFLFLYYCLLVAYFSGGAPLLSELFVWIGIPVPPFVGKLVFFFLFGLVIALGAHWINRVNLLLTVGMFVSYAILVVIGMTGVRDQTIVPVDFSLATLAVPVLFSAFGFHNIIPSLTSLLHREKRILQYSIVGGTFLAFVFYIIWIWLVLGSVPVAALESVKLQGMPVTYALQTISGNSSIYALGQIFAFFALTTSFLGVGFSFVDFVRDGMHVSGKMVTRFFCVLVTLVPPFICVLINPTLFEEALGIAGGFGESILNGLVPAMLCFQMYRYSKQRMPYPLGSLLVFLIIISLFVIGIEGYTCIK